MSIKNWEGELDVLFGKLWLPTDGEGKYGAVNTLIKDFIRTLLSEQLEEMREKIFSYDFWTKWERATLTRLLQDPTT